MEKKKLLFGLIEINKTMYNILYTLLCVGVLLSIIVISGFGLTGMIQESVITEVNVLHIFLIDVVVLFLGYKIMSKKHYA